jgi:hypothetical protein
LFGTELAEWHGNPSKETTVGIEQLVEDVTERAAAELAEACPALDEMAGHLRRPLVEPEWYLELSAGLDWFGNLLELVETLGQAASARDSGLVEERAELLTRSRAILHQIVGAQEFQDNLLLADLLQYELKPLLLERVAPLLPLFAGQIHEPPRPAEA